MRTIAGNHSEKAGLLERLNEEFARRVRQSCCRCVGEAVGVMARMPHPRYFGPSALRNGAMVSIGMGKMVVEFFSAAISTRV